jgi:hypothetical protein
MLYPSHDRGLESLESSEIARRMSGVKELDIANLMKDASIRRY